MASPPLPPLPADTETSTILFRPSKKRKIYRQRHTSRSPSPSSTAAPAPLPQPSNTSPPAAQTLDDLIASSAHPAAEDVDAEGTAVSMAEILRLRKMRRQRVGGVEFTAATGAADGRGRAADGDEDGGRALVKVGEQLEPPPPVVRRFAPQTGMVGDVDRHMMAYIDSELAKRRSEGLQTSSHAAPTSSANTTPREPSKVNLDVQRQPAALGKLLEIDLGSEARDRNVQRTEKARRKMDGEEVDDDEDEEGKGKKKPVKVRLGPDGKPWRGGRRKRRGSDDVKRDQLVEDVLRENRLEIYDSPLPPPTTTTSDPADDQAADDRIAEAFRREFMDAVSARQRKKAAGPAPPPSRGPGGKKEEEVLKGPKLGGSRSARAAVREALLKEARKGGS